ncbi:MAG: hypothetical protein UHP27_08650 [Muribaculaceae bacterium]|nr:hypothetical protein [Muribaculaceae bacterium]
MMYNILFWTGIAIFAVGMAIRIGYRIKYYREYRSIPIMTTGRAAELRGKYRSRIFYGLLCMVAGCILAVISAAIA